jgi:glycosyltransferase involved in cell wall biosynthesis
MHVGLLIYGSLETISGGYLYDRKLVEHLRRCGDEVEVISLPWRNYARHLTDNFDPALIARLQTSRFDVLLQDELNHPSLFLLNRRLRGRYPLLAIVHHLRSSEQRPAWQNVFDRWVERRYLQSVDGFVFNSETTRIAVEDLAGPSGEVRRQRPVRSVTVYPAGDRFQPTLTPEDIRNRARHSSFHILFVGNVIRRKGLHTLLTALARLKIEDWRLEIVGSLTVDAKYVEDIRRQIERDGLKEAIVWHGPLSDAELAGALARSHVLAVPSLYEGFGIVYQEGMGFGLPALAAGAGAAGEIVTHGENGFLIQPGDAGALANYLRVLMTDRERLTTMSLAAQKRFAAHPTWEESVEKIRNFLHAL